MGGELLHALNCLPLHDMHTAAAIEAIVKMGRDVGGVGDVNVDGKVVTLGPMELFVMRCLIEKDAWKGDYIKQHILVENRRKIIQSVLQVDSDNLRTRTCHDGESLMAALIRIGDPDMVEQAVNKILDEQRDQ